MSAAAKLIEGVDSTTIEQQRSDQFWNLACELASLNGETRGWTSQEVAQTLDQTEQSRQDLELAIRQILKRRDYQDRVETLAGAEVEKAGIVERLTAFISHRNEVIERLRDQERMIRHELAASDEQIRLAKDAKRQLQMSARKTPALERARQEETKLRIAMSSIEGELKRVEGWIQGAAEWAGVSEEHARGARQDAMREKRRLADRIRPLQEQLNGLVVRREQLEARAMEVL